MRSFVTMLPPPELNSGAQVYDAGMWRGGRSEWGDEGGRRVGVVWEGHGGDWG